MDASILTNLFHIGPDAQTTVSVLEKIVRPVLVYLFLVVGLRLAGKRELAQLNAFDLVVLLTHLEHGAERHHRRRQLACSAA